MTNSGVVIRKKMFSPLLEPVCYESRESELPLCDLLQDLGSCATQLSVGFKQDT